ncbi:MAG: SRPBCC domain-containing protein [Phycisphaerae bacterium]|nr:SRPBCC domain-containing protein [Saprospiraceae bacterium]
MNKGLIAKASISINASAAKIWDALINPEMIKQYMFGADTISDWKVGSPIVWKGAWEGKPYEDKGVILKIEPEKTLKYSHFSPLEGLPEVSENYHTVTYRLSDKGYETNVSLSQDNNANEKALENSEKMWGNMLTELKKLLEK